MIPDQVAPSIPCTLVPWLSVRRSAEALEFYKKAFGAVEVYRLEHPENGVVARLSVDGAEFWLAEESPETNAFSPETLDGSTSRLILTVSDPDAAFARALRAGAREVRRVSEEHGWRIGRIVDPYGHHWEIGRPLNPATY
jgi:PhnB protein